MSMGSAPCSGYVLEATEENFKKLNVSLGKYKNRYRRFLKENPEDCFEDFLGTLVSEEGTIGLTAKLPEMPTKPICIYMFRYDSDNGDCYDDITDGVYFSFDEDTIFHKELNPIGKLLKRKRMLPEYKQWTQYD